MKKQIQISPVKPRSYYRHYSNPDCQESLIRATAFWPKPSNMQACFEPGCVYMLMNKKMRKEEQEPVFVPDDLEISSAYLDRMGEWDRTKLQEAWKLLSNGLDSSDEELIAFTKAYFGVDVVAVRTVYYFNVATGYDCPRIDYLYRKGEK